MVIGIFLLTFPSPVDVGKSRFTNYRLPTTDYIGK